MAQDINITKNPYISDDILKKNISLFLEKYPKYTFFISKENIDEESFKNRYLTPEIIDKYKRLSDNLPDISSKEVIYIYGVGIGLSYPIFESWLAENRANNLVFIESAEKKISSFLSTSLATDILINPKVHVHFKLSFEEESEFLESVVFNFFSGKIKVLADPNISDEEKKDFSIINNSLLQLSTYYVASHVDDLYSYINFSHFYKNIGQIPSSFFADELKDKFKGVPAVICGAGPSLEKDIETLKKIGDKALIIAGGSAIPALLNHGIRPHLGVVIDPNVDEVHRMQSSKKIDIPILYSMRVHSDVFKCFKGPTIYMSNISGGVESLYLEESLEIESDYMLGQNLTKDALSVTTLNLELARFMGCSSIILSGVDLSYQNNKRYSSAVTDSDNEIRVKDNDPGDILIEKGGGLFTSVKWEMEAKAISNYQKQFELDIVTTSEKGLPIEGVSYVSLREISDKMIEKIDITDILNSIFSNRNNNKKVAEENVSLFKKTIKESLISSKKLIGIIKDEAKGLVDKKTTPLMIVYERELKEEIAYKYLLSRSKHALSRQLKGYYSIDSESSISDRNRYIYELWDKLYAISSKYIEALT